MIVPLHQANVRQNLGPFTCEVKKLPGNRTITVGYQDNATDKTNPAVCIVIQSPSLTPDEISELKFSLSYDAASALASGLLQIIQHIEAQHHDHT